MTKKADFEADKIRLQGRSAIDPTSGHVIENVAAVLFGEYDLSTYRSTTDQEWADYVARLGERGPQDQGGPILDPKPWVFDRYNGERYDRYTEISDGGIHKTAFAPRPEFVQDPTAYPWEPEPRVVQYGVFITYPHEYRQDFFIKFYSALEADDWAAMMRGKSETAKVTTWTLRSTL